MAEEADDLVLELLRAMRGDMSRIADDLKALRVEMQAGRHHVRGLELTPDVQFDSLAELRKHVDRIERRLELSDPAGFSDDTPPYEPRLSKRGG